MDIKSDYINTELFSKWFNNSNSDFTFINDPLAIFDVSSKTIRNISIPKRSIKYIGYFRIEFTGIQYDNYIFSPSEINLNLQYIRSKIIRYKEITKKKTYHCILAKSIDGNDLELYDPMGGNWVILFPNVIDGHRIHIVQSNIYPQKIESGKLTTSGDELSGYCQTWCLIYIYQFYFNQNLSIVEWLDQYKNKNSDELRKHVFDYNFEIRKLIGQPDRNNTLMIQHQYNRQNALNELIKLL